MGRNKKHDLTSYFIDIANKLYDAEVKLIGEGIGPEGVYSDEPTQLRKASMRRQLRIKKFHELRKVAVVSYDPKVLR